MKPALPRPPNWAAPELSSDVADRRWRAIGSRTSRPFFAGSTRSASPSRDRPRSLADRQLPGQRAGRSGRPVRLGLRAARRRRPACSPRCSAERPKRATGRSSSSRPDRDRTAISSQHADPGHAVHGCVPAMRSRSSTSAPISAGIGRSYRPVAFARIVRPVAGSPRIRVVCGRPAAGARPCDQQIGGIQPHPLPDRDDDAAADHDGAGRHDPRRARVPARARAAFLPRPRRELRRRPGASIAGRDARRDRSRNGRNGCAGSPSRSNGRTS